MVPRNDHLWIGLAVSFFVSIIGFGLFIQLGEWFMGGAAEGQGIAFRPRTLALMAICLNLLPMNIFRRTYRTRSLKGLVIGVMILAAGWFFYFGRELLNG